MTREEAENGRDDMLIDGCEAEPPQENAVPDGFNANYLKVYYGKLFPHDDMFRWLSYGNDGKHPGCDQSFFGRREFSFTLDNDIYLRFQSFNSASEMEKSINEKCPFKIDIGPVYNVDPAKRHAYAQGGDNGFTPMERELIFDVTILDSITFCGCTVDDAESIVGFVMGKQEGKILEWLNNEQRAAIADYFRVYKGNENSHKKVSLMGQGLHPFLARSYTEVLEQFFEKKLLCSQKMFSNEERFEKILEMIPDESITSELRGKWQESRRSSTSKDDINVVRWGQLKQMLQSGKQKVLGLRRCVEEIVFSYAYPRLDMEEMGMRLSRSIVLKLKSSLSPSDVRELEVSKHMNHLLKAPFCIHPKTGRVCVPIDPDRCEEFDPTTVPTLSKLMGELNMGVLRSDGNDEWDKTSLGKSVRYFRSHFLQPLLKSCKEEIESSYKAKLQESKNSLSWRR